MSQKYGQHFLIDDDVLMGIANTVAQTQQKCGCDRLIEIGPGEGVLTELIVDLFDHVTLYEIDERMRAKLYPITSKHPDGNIVWGDVLDIGTNPPQSPFIKGEGCRDDGTASSTLVVGNLPYYITSPILRKFFEPNVANPYPKGSLPLIRGQQLTEQNIYPGGVFLVQKEVAQKIASNAKKKSFLRWIVNYMYDVEYQFTVGPEAFNPPPKVDSAVLVMKEISLNPSLGEGGILPPPNRGGLRGSRPDYTRMMTFLDIVSGLKRKTLGKIRKMRAELLEDFVLPEELRGKRIEELGWEGMCRICG